MFPQSAQTIYLAVIALVLISAASNALAGSAPAQEISPGTVITQQNWREYKPFMSEGLTALFEGSHFWHMPSGLQMNVGPTRSIPFPKQYLTDTARYSGSVKLPIGLTWSTSGMPGPFTALVAATNPAWMAWGTSMEWPVTSPAAKICGAEVRKYSSTFTNFR